MRVLGKFCYVFYEDYCQKYNVQKFFFYIIVGNVKQEFFVYFFKEVFFYFYKLKINKNVEKKNVEINLNNINYISMLLLLLYFFGGGGVL